PRWRLLLVYGGPFQKHHVSMQNVPKVAYSMSVGDDVPLGPDDAVARDVVSTGVYEAEGHAVRWVCASSLQSSSRNRKPTVTMTESKAPIPAAMIPVRFMPLDCAFRSAMMPMTTAAAPIRKPRNGIGLTRIAKMPAMSEIIANPLLVPEAAAIGWCGDGGG